MSTEERAIFLNIMIKHLRIGHGWTQTQLGEIIGCSQREIWRYEKPGYKVSPLVLLKLSDAFGCSMDVLFGNTQHPVKFKALEEFRVYREREAQEAEPPINLIIG